MVFKWDNVFGMLKIDFIVLNFMDILFIEN